MRPTGEGARIASTENDEEMREIVILCFPFFGNKSNDYLHDLPRVLFKQTKQNKAAKSLDSCGPGNPFHNKSALPCVDFSEFLDKLGLRT